jgi:uncharacterized lipoprotein YddW (UPF0748 family)
MKSFFIRTAGQAKYAASILAGFLAASTSLVHAAVPAIPDPPRDYRAAWCATVSNIDWPPRSGTSSAIVSEQKARLLQHLDAMADANMNAMYLQVRPACDAMYNSPIEPWSQWLTGSQLTNATWDPLTFAVDEAHKRGIELHAWVNPYRAALDHSTSNKSAKHVTRARPDLCVQYSDGKTYMNPGKAGTITWITNVIEDMVTRYDIDGVVFDDYFYPGTDFPDDATYQAYLNNGGTMNLNDWRRDNVDRLIQQCYTRIHQIRNSCQFSVGPFGIWRPGNPPGIIGSDYYATHYCDTRKWLRNGWVDSLSPQLYWPTDSPGQPFGALIEWWADQNPNRHVMASTADYRVGSSAYNTGGNMWSTKTAQEIVSQVNLTHQLGGVGNVHYSIRWLTEDPKGVRAALRAGPYAKDALRPASTWLDSTPPPPPTASTGTPYGVPPRRNITFSQSPTDEKAAYWVVYTYNGSQWKWAVLPGESTSYVAAEPVVEYAVSAVDRSGNESARTGFTAVNDWNLY